MFLSPFINLLILANWLVAVVYCFSPTEAKLKKASSFVWDHLGMKINNRAMLGFSLEVTKAEGAENQTKHFQIQSSDTLFYVFISNMLVLFLFLLICIIFSAQRIIVKVSSDLSNRNHYASIYRLLLLQCVSPTLFTIFPCCFNILTGIIGADLGEVPGHN